MATYEFILRNGSGASDDTYESPIADEERQANKQRQKELEGRRVLAQQIIAVDRFVEPFIAQAIQHEVSLVSLKTGNAERQARAEFNYKVASQMWGIGKSIGIGAVVGGGLGAVVGAFTGVVNTAIGYTYKRDTLNKERQLEGMSLSLANARAGGGIWATVSESRT